MLCKIANMKKHQVLAEYELQGPVWSILIFIECMGCVWSHNLKSKLNCFWRSRASYWDERDCNSTAAV